jgi:hypothetical protein
MSREGVSLEGLDGRVYDGTVALEGDAVCYTMPM